MSLLTTASQTVGPYLKIGFAPLTVNALAPDKLSGERITIQGRLLDGDGKPVSDGVVEIWQANAQGNYRFVTIKPGAYPWRNHYNAWRPAHLHFSIFGIGLVQRLVTQMYFPGDPLLPLDPIFNCVPDAAARDRLIASFDLDITQPEYALGYRFDFVLRGRGATPFEDKEHR